MEGKGSSGLPRVREKSGKLKKNSRSGNCQGILLTVREIWKYSQMSGNCQRILKILRFKSNF